MKLLYIYLKKYKLLVFITLLLAAISQIFSLLDPTFLGKYIIDDLGKHPFTFSDGSARNVSQFVWGVIKAISLLLGVAMISRIAKAFQDYTNSVVVQRMGADIYSDGLRHSLQQSFQEFEDKQSGQTLNIIQKVRQDVEKLISSSINILFSAFVGLIFVSIVAFKIYPPLIPIYFLASTILAFVTFFMSKKIKKVQTLLEKPIYWQVARLKVFVI